MNDESFRVELAGLIPSIFVAVRAFPHRVLCRLGVCIVRRAEASVCILFAGIEAVNFR